ncbi:Protein of unknown function (DUF2442) [Thioflavicoccus mobilis 8321]|uniref:DUF2442 domain-containing protein n=1 Tax=Thioflavicoccus mobilis 8321 TaxID=765912 RepID=L0GVH7_9GAMM|nr:DUF2442 domain-containing protein [Thioflavicoccus mobilis]AGA89375.1 Protein of unknown function (DUF2442) [Thioflavicoccus mobilis 8321]
MIKIVQAEVIANHVVRLAFSDGSSGELDLTELLDRDGEMVRPLKDPAFFADCFLELGALCWRNGFELSASSLHRKLAHRGALRQADAA